MNSQLLLLTVIMLLIGINVYTWALTSRRSADAQNRIAAANERLAKALEESNTHTEKEFKSLERITWELEQSNRLTKKRDSQRFIKTFMVDVEACEDETLTEVLDQEVTNLLGKDIQIHDVQDVFYKNDPRDFFFHGVVRTVIYSHR